MLQISYYAITPVLHTCDNSITYISFRSQSYDISITPDNKHPKLQKKNVRLIIKMKRTEYK